MNKPLVSVICLCFNHEHFVREAIFSVLNQTYSNVEIIVVDDCSTDGSRAVIEAIVSDHPEIRFIPLETNQGICRAFNYALQFATGMFIVDFATDDVFLPERIEKQVNHFDGLDADYGVIFTDAIYINEDGSELRRHFAHLRKYGLLKTIPQGDVYKEVIRQYFVCGPTMLVRREVFDKLGGYDETLAYEDFDFWVRSARHFRYAVIDEVLTKVRETTTSLSRKQYAKGDRQLASTIRVCEKAVSLNRTADENSVLLQRLRYELRHCVLTGNRVEARHCYDLIRKLGGGGGVDRLVFMLGRLGLPLRPLRALYHWVRYS